MDIHRITSSLFVTIFLLSACAAQIESVSHAATLPPPTETAALPTEVPIETPTEVPATKDPSLFAALEKSRLDPLASNIQDAVFITAMDGFLASGNILEYRIIESEAFPASDGKIIVQIYYNVRTMNPSWLLEGGKQVENGWITDICNRFDFVNTETEFQLKNRRTCN